MKRKCFVPGKKSKKRAFSLIAVLILTFAGMALVGGIMYTFQSFAGASQVASAQNVQYNLLQDGIQKGRAILRARMSTLDPPPRWYEHKVGVDSSSSITSAEDLMLVSGEVYSKVLDPSDLAGVGKQGKIFVKIYDMNYEAGKVTISDPAEISLLPPAINIDFDANDWNNRGDPLKPGEAAVTAGGGGGTVNFGIYLIRAYLEIDGAETQMLDNALLQANSATAGP
jgi:hypothetical protein